MFDGIDLSKLDLNKMMGDMQKMAEQSKEQNASQIFTSKSGGGMVSISINGNSQVIDLQIDDTLLDDKDSLNILLISAMNDVLKQAQDNQKSMAMNMMGNLGSLGKQ